MTKKVNKSMPILFPWIPQDDYLWPVSRILRLEQNGRHVVDEIVNAYSSMKTTEFQI